MKAILKKHMDDVIADQVERDRAWLPHDRRGRWVVIESGPGRYLTGSPRHIRRLVDLVTPRRARRFSSLSHARAFARSIGGHVSRWRSAPPGGGIWQRISPWERALSMTDVGLWLPARMVEI